METARLDFQIACESDVVAIVELLADDPLGARRERFEDPLPASYLEAFETLTADPNHELCSNGRFLGPEIAAATWSSSRRMRSVRRR